MRRLTLVLVIALVAALGVAGWQGWRWLVPRIDPDRCYLMVEGRDEPLRITHEQAVNSSIIVAESFNKGLPEQAAIVALATAWQESGLRNLDHGDRDSLGLFQQRPSYGWGTEAQLQDPWYSSGRFYEEIVKFDNWETTDVNDMAQKVQRSGHPEAYRKHEANARALAGALRGTRPGTLACQVRWEAGADTATLFKVLQAVPGVTVEHSSGQFVVKDGDSTARWAAAQLTVANAPGAGIKRITHEDKEWRPDARAWSNNRMPLDDSGVVVALTDE